MRYFHFTKEISCKMGFVFFVITQLLGQKSSKSQKNLKQNVLICDLGI